MGAERKYKVGDRFNYAWSKDAWQGLTVRRITGEGSRSTYHAIDPVRGEGFFSETMMEPAPLFAVGDKVRYKKGYGTATVVSIDRDGGVVVDTHGEYGVCTERPADLEPAPVAASNDNATPKFKVGDRVKFRDDYGTSARGKEATVVAIDVWEKGKGIKVSRDGSLYGTSTEHAKDLVLVPPLTIQAGRFYKTRDGRKVGPMEDRGDKFAHARWKDSEHTWFTDGSWWSACTHPLDLIAEWPTENHDPASTAGFTVPLCACDGERTEAPIIFEGGVFKIHEATTIADIVARLEKLEAKPEPLKVGDEVMLAVPARVTGFHKKNACLVLNAGGSFSLPTAELKRAA